MRSIRGMKDMSIRTNDQSGMVSITVTLLFVLVSALVVIGFTQIAQRNSRQALDRQLSAQAQYAAETAINDAQSVLLQDYANGAALRDQTDCTGVYTKNGGVVDQNVSYTCLMVNSRPSSLSYDNVSDGSIVFPLNTSDGSNLDTIEINWQKSSSAPSSQNLSGCPTGHTLPATVNWQPANCSYGLMRIELIPNTPAAMQSATSANIATMSVLAAPTPSSGSAAIPSVSYSGGHNRTIQNGDANQGIRVAPNCTNANGCTIRLNNLAFANAYVRIRMMYVDAANVRVGYSSATTDNRTFTGAQVVIDATGRAQDVLRRIQVRAPLAQSSGTTSDTSLSDYAIQTSGSLCKRFSVAPGSPGVANDEANCTN